MTSANRLLAESWDTPFGVPPLDLIGDEDYTPAFIEGMKRQKLEITAIIENPAAADFENTIVALERTGGLLRRVSRIFFPRQSAHTNETLQAVARDIAPLLSAHRDDIYFDKTLFDRVHAVHESRSDLNLSPEKTRLLTETHKEFVRSGVGLSDDNRARVREINAELSGLSTRFGENLLAETNGFKLIIEDTSELEGLPAVLVAAAASEAERLELGGQVRLHRPSTEHHSVSAVLTESRDAAHARGWLLQARGQ